MSKRRFSFRSRLIRASGARYRCRVRADALSGYRGFSLLGDGGAPPAVAL